MRDDDSLHRYADQDELTRAQHRAAQSALGEYLRALQAHWTIVVLVILGSVTAAVAWTTVRPPSSFWQRPGSWGSRCT